MKDYLLAQVQHNIGNPINGVGPLGSNSADSGTTFNRVMSLMVGVLTIVAILWFMVNLITGAYSLMSSEGDKNAVEIARKKITNSLIGLVIVIVAIFVIDLIGTFFGVGHILDVNYWITNLTPAV